MPILRSITAKTNFVNLCADSLSALNSLLAADAGAGHMRRRDDSTRIILKIHLPILAGRTEESGTEYNLYLINRFNGDLFTNNARSVKSTFARCTRTMMTKCTLFKWLYSTAHATLRDAQLIILAGPRLKKNKDFKMKCQHL